MQHRELERFHALVLALAKAPPVSGQPRYSRGGPKRLRRTRRDGNESIRKGLGATNRSCRLDWLPYGMTWGDLKIERQQPLFAFHEDGERDSYDVFTFIAPTNMAASCGRNNIRWA